MNKRVIRLILILIVAGGGALLAYNKVNKDKEVSMAKKDVHHSRELMVDGYVVKATSLKNDINATGNLMSNETILVQPQISGRITHLYFKEGSRVHKGDLLVSLYDGDLQAQLEKARIQHRLADTTLARQEQLLARGGISRQEVDNSRNQVAAYQADIDYYTAQISETKIVAPFDGRVGLRQVSEGAIVSPSTVITTLYQNDPIKLQFSVPEKYRNQVELGDQVSFTVAERPGRSFKGRVYAIDPGIDPRTLTATLRALVPNPQGLLAPGSFANVHVTLHEIQGALMIPAQSLILTTRASQVIASRNGKATVVNVETGIQTPSQVQITSGLKAGDTVLTTGVMQATAGTPLRFLEVTE